MLNLRITVEKFLEGAQTRVGKYAVAIALGIVVTAASILLLNIPVKARLGTVDVPDAFRTVLAAKERLVARQSPYHPALEPAYTHSPGVLVPVQWFPQDAATAWFWISLSMVIAWAVVLSISSGRWTIRTVFLLLFGLGLAWPATFESLQRGQLELLLFVIAAFGAYFVNKVPILSGLLIGTLPWFRLQWAILFLPFILVVTQKKRWRLAQFFLGYFMAMLTWGAGIFNVTFGSDRGMELTREWFSILKEQRLSLFLDSNNQSLWISLTRWLGDASLSVYGLTAMIVGLLLGRMVARSTEVRPYGGELAWISPWLMIGQLMNPLSWKWANVFVIGMPLAFAQGKWIDNIWVRRLLVVCVITLMLLVQYAPFTQKVGIDVQADLLGYGVLTLQWLLLLILCL